MNSKLKAGLITLALAGWCVIVAMGLKAISLYFTVDQISLGLAVAGIALCFYVVYSLVLTKLEFDDRLKKLVDKV
jgi:hypothetical protein